jgi:N-acetylglucosaminyldiphosphoundecaprenol N-acetyl-beta-D-mannosaminyltransferase
VIRVLSQESEANAITKNTLFYIDGSLLTLFLIIISNKRISRISFDQTSLAPVIFQHINDRNLKLAVIGGDKLDNENFQNKIMLTYPNIEIVFAQDGFYNDEEKLVSDTSKAAPDFILLGLGTPKQELLGIKLKKQITQAQVYTCGGFITQSSKSNDMDYYPPWINKLNLRAFYRFLKEPHTRKRYIYNYPKNLIILLYLILSSRIKIKVS